MRIPLDDSATVTLDADGNGVASIGPSIGAVSWHVTNIGVSASENAQEPVCQVFTPQGTFYGGTFTGSNDSTTADITIARGGRLRAVWTGGVPGATATLSVFGTQET